MASRYKTGDRVRVRMHPDVDPAYFGLEGTIVAWMPRSTGLPYATAWLHRPPHPGDFFINFDDPPTNSMGTSQADRVHQGGPWHDALVEDAPPEPTIGEIADLFGIDPYEVAKAALEET